MTDQNKSPPVHTPTPWLIEPPSMGFSQITGANGELVFGLAAGGPSEKQPDAVCEANAALIVRAVNSHAELLEALENLVADMTSSAELKLYISEDDETIKAARIAIAKARGDA
ncbi:MAG: hypothetical protein LAP61_05755 [Acidobacteriia bacterium]|nr:hypothetical protein [Terriglobia bacterium]